MPPWFADLEPGGMRFTAIGSKLYANGERLHIKGVNWFGSEGRSGPPLGLDKHTSKRALTRGNKFLVAAPGQSGGLPGGVGPRPP